MRDMDSFLEKLEEFLKKLSLYSTTFSCTEVETEPVCNHIYTGRRAVLARTSILARLFVTRQ
jgi:hypothetical protein